VAARAREQVAVELGTGERAPGVRHDPPVTSTGVAEVECFPERGLEAKDASQARTRQSVGHVRFAGRVIGMGPERCHRDAQPVGEWQVQPPTRPAGGL